MQARHPSGLMRIGASDWPPRRMIWGNLGRSHTLCWQTRFCVELWEFRGGYIGIQYVGK